MLGGLMGLWATVAAVRVSSLPEALRPMMINRDGQKKTG